MSQKWLDEPHLYYRGDHGEHLCHVIPVTFGSLQIFDRISTVGHNDGDTLHSRQCTFASYLCCAHFPLEEVEKIDLQLLHAK